MQWIMSFAFFALGLWIGAIGAALFIKNNPDFISGEETNEGDDSDG